MKKEKKDYKIFLAHIIECIEEIESFVKGFNKVKFLNNRKTQAAVERTLAIMGEAVNNLPAYFRKKYSKIKWDKARAMRNILIHEYFRIDLDIVWEVIGKDLPQFKKQVLNILEELKH